MLRRTGSEHKSHLLSDGTSGHNRSAGESSESADIRIQMLEGGEGICTKSTHRLIKLVKSKI